MADNDRDNIVRGAFGDLERLDLKTGGGGGNSGDMETRVALLEASAAQAKADLAEIKSDLKSLVKDVAGLKGEISRLPGYPGLLGVAGLIIAAVGLMLRFLPPAIG